MPPGLHGNLIFLSHPAGGDSHGASQAPSPAQSRDAFFLTNKRALITGVPAANPGTIRPDALEVN